MHKIIITYQIIEFEEFDNGNQHFTIKLDFVTNDEKSQIIATAKLLFITDGTDSIITNG